MHRVRRIKNDDVIDPMARNQVQHLVDQVAMRVDDTEPLPALDVRRDELLQQGRLARAGLPDHINMPLPVRSRNAKGDLLSPNEPVADV